MNVVILGASDRPNRYAYRAFQLLHNTGYHVFPVSRDGKDIESVPGYRSLADLPANLDIDTVTVYLRPELQAQVIDDLVAIAPRRVIFNPGTESDETQHALKQAGIEILEACTLVLLQTGQF